MIYTAWLIWLIPLFSVPFVALLGMVDRRLRGWFAVAVSGLSLVLATIGALDFAGPTTETLPVWFPPLNISLQVQVDSLSVLVAAFVSFVSFLVVVYSIGYMQKEGGEGLTRYYSLILLFIGGMLGLVMAGNLIQFYFFWEIVGVCSALLIAFWTDREAARKAGVKAFVVTRFGDAALLLAVILIWTIFGNTSFSSILGPQGFSTLGGGTVFLIGVLVLVGAMGKSAQVPLHGWLPDAMEGPTTVSALIHAATMVNAGVFLMVRMLPLFQLQQVLLSVVLFVGLLSALVGGVCAFGAQDLKRVLAYSTISQLGLMFAAVGLGSGVAATYHMVSQGLFKALAFLAAGSVITAVGTRDMEGMGGLRKQMKYTFVGFTLAMLAMSGLPPLIGFWSKDSILSLAFAAGPLQVAAFVLAFTATGLYSFRALVKVFFGQPRGTETAKESPAVMLGPILALSVSVVLAWGVLYPQTLYPISALGLPDAVTLTTSLAVFAASLVMVYLAFSVYAQRTKQLAETSSGIKSLKGALLEGLGFDRLYSGIYRGVAGPLARLAASIQTGLLETNTALILLAVAAVFVLFAVGVL
ncbi:MAG TPA: NADH-quinone oxidoreductase subunit L [Nitrososphaerales archaeon]|nr:NADH-quinone oxidoreductase subunit L [Nitrososphaerales archaeon]